ncbi:MAG: hypothetical protein NXI02_31000 [Rhodobacteraceae bacterium]|nr:hypothetical protein [Paracoccaceae bacterium]
MANIFQAKQAPQCMYTLPLPQGAGCDLVSISQYGMLQRIVSGAG